MKRIHSKMSYLLPDLPAGPLDYYRKKASFDWKNLKLFIDSEDVLEYQNELHKELQKHPDYQKNLLSPTFDEERRIDSRRSFIHKSIELLSLEYALANLKIPAAANRTMMQFAPSAAVKYSVGSQLFSSVVLTMGTERHQKIYQDSQDGNIFGCYCLTEIGHGTNTKGMRTIVTFDKENKDFIIHSPDFEAAKCWAGGLGQTASHAVVYAQLTVDDIPRGLHAFVVEIRNPKTLIPHPGVIVGDMGEKIGLNGVDNGFLMFDNYRIPRESLLNKLADVTEAGEYVTPFKDPNKRHGASLGALSAGRVNITGICEAYGTQALTIAIRYAGVRRQFGPDGEKEIPILEYPTHQIRLLPYLAVAYALRIFNAKMIKTQYEFSINSFMGTNDKEKQADLGLEIHAVSSASKPVAGWVMRDAIQECRECCGGHGYLKVSGIGDVRNNHDANMTYEGENHVLIQQTSNWLLKMWPLILKRQKITTPLRSIDFLSNGLQILKETKFTAKTIEEICDPRYIMALYDWLVVYLLQRTFTKLENNLKSGKSSFWARHENQVFYGKNLSMAFIQRFTLQTMLEKINEAEDADVKNVLLKLFSLYGLWSLEKHLPTLYQGELAEGPNPTTLIQDAILQLCHDLKDDAISLVDAVAPPDFILNSVLGAADGKVYQRLRNAILSNPYSMSRPKWWQDVVNWKTNVVPKNKL